MPLKCELTADLDRGPGYGVLRIAGLPSGMDPRVSLLATFRRNQGTEIFLGGDGRWQAAAVSQTLPAWKWDGEQAVIALGPALFDPLVQLSPNVRVQLSLAYDGKSDAGVLTLRPPLYPSFAVKETSTSGPVPAVELAPIASPTPLKTAGEPSPVEPIHRENRGGATASPPRRGLRLVLIGGAIASLLLLLAGGGLLWKKFLASAPSPAATGSPGIDSREDLARYLGDTPSREALEQIARDLTVRGKLDLAMLTWQQAARQGSSEAGVALGKMYDPETWSATSSPLPQADAETAAYWYEPAAKAGNLEAQRRLGKLWMRAPGDGGPQVEKGRGVAAKGRRGRGCRSGRASEIGPGARVLDRRRQEIFADGAQVFLFFFP